METVTVSSKYQVVIPKETRRSAKIKAGDKLKFMTMNGHIILVPEVEMEKYRGFLKNMDLGEFKKDKTDRDFDEYN